MKEYPVYKDSEYDWTGNIPEHWKMVQLKFAAPRKTDQTEDVKEFAFQIALENIESKTGKLTGNGSFEGLGNIFRKGDVLFNKLRPYLCKVVIAPADGVAVSELLVLRPRKDIDHRFLFYRLLESKFISVVDGSTYGAKMPRANWDFIGNLKIPTPPIPEQQAIADFLDCKTAQIDTLIEKKQRQIDLLQEQRTALINHAVTKGLNPDSRMKDSGVEWLGEIPSHWNMVRLRHISPSISVGLVIQPTQYVDPEGTVPFLYGSNIRENSFLLDDVRKISPESSLKLNTSMLHAGDLVTVRVGYPGVTAVIPSFLEGANCASMMIVRKSDFILSEYLCYVMNSRVGMFQIEAVAYGAAQKQFNISHAVDFIYPIPLAEEQKSIVDYLEGKSQAIYRLISIIRKQIESLQEYRTALISEAVTGKIDVR